MILIIDCGSTKTSKIGDNLKGLGQASTTVSLADNWRKLNQYSGIIISGAPILITETAPQHYLDKFRFLTSITIPVLGICFGHQILGMIYGARVSKCKEAREPIEIAIENQYKIFRGLKSSATFSEDHCEMITLPKEFVQTASSPFCEIEGMQHQSKQLFGVQFHPETSGNNGIQLFNNFSSICDNKK